MKKAAEPVNIACQQVLTTGSSVSSLQWTVIPGQYVTQLTPQLLLEKYLGYIRHATFSLVRPASTSAGIEFRLLGSSTSILTFTKPTVGDGGNSISLAIAGGFLVQPDQCDRGEMSLSCEPCEDGIKVMLSLSDYCPLLLGGFRTSRVRKWLYRLTQAFIHKRVTVTFLGRVYREVAGKDVCIRVVKVDTMAGEEI